MSRSSFLLTAGALALLVAAAGAQTKTIPGERQTITATGRGDRAVSAAS